MKAVPDWAFVPKRCEIGLVCGLEGRDELDCFIICGQWVKGGDPPRAAFLRPCLEHMSSSGGPRTSKTWTC